MKRFICALVLLGLVTGCGLRSRGNRSAGALAASLESGMELVYVSEQGEQPAWVVDSIDLRARFGDRFNCAYVSFARTDIRRLCLAGDTLLAWNERSNRLEPQRVVGPNAAMTSSGPRGGRILYQTGRPEQAEVSGHRLTVIPTTIITFDSTGQAIRRLRERYALSLVTAVDGVFETVDSAGGWRSHGRFTLVRIGKQ